MFEIVYTLLDIFMTIDTKIKGCFIMCLNLKKIKGNYVPCGKCIECLLQYSTEWAFRCSLEASLYKDNCFLTLTYNDANLPVGASLCKSDLQLFIKLLRKEVARKEEVTFTYFACGEYGALNNRPHYHLIIFGWKPKDLVYFFTDNKSKENVFQSPQLSRIWHKGFVSVGENITLDTAKYCAKYLQKQVDSSCFVKPFVLMSKRVPLGFNAYNLKWIQTDKIYLNGKTLRTPRAFLRRLDKNGLCGFVEEILVRRKENSLNRSFWSSNEEFLQEYDLYLSGVADKLKKFKRIFGNDINEFGVLLTDKKKKRKKFLEKVLTSTLD